MTTKQTRLWKILGKQHFIKSAQREDGLITYHPSSDVTVSQQRTTEREAFENAGEKPIVHPTHNKDFDANAYKMCTKCKHNRKLQYFGKKTNAKTGAIYFQSWCNFCAAEYASEQYYKSTLTLRG